MLLGGCQGAQVSAPNGDASPKAADTADASDSATDSGALSDAAPEDGTSPFDASFPGACTSAAANLVANGNFESGLAGWSTTFAKATPAGPAACGFAMRIHETGTYGALFRREFRTIAAGATAHLRVWVKGNGVSGGVPPRAVIRLLRASDAGPDTPSEEVMVSLTLGSTWTFGQATLVTKAETTHFDAMVTSMRVDGVGDDYFVAGVALVVE